jgi:menaquinone-9 beta-reductase
MITATAVIVGGGPAGSSCAWRLGTLGIDCIVLDKSRFPREKLCAGWITPDVVERLALRSGGGYPAGMIELKRMNVEYFGLGGGRKFDVGALQYSIRRYEFDAWNLARSGAPVHEHRVEEIREEGGHFVIDGKFRGRFLVGAGGTHCPVFRALFKDVNHRSREYQVAALEEEFEDPTAGTDCHLWFGENGLVGYAWFVPKDGGWANVGLGGFCEYLDEAEVGLREHWAAFTKKLVERGMVGGRTFKPKGHTYYVREPVKVCQRGQAFVIGDAAGLATCDLGEGIGPAVHSGLDAAESIASGRPYSVASIPRYSLVRGVAGWLAEHVVDRRGLVFRDWVLGRGWKGRERAFSISEKREVRP